MRYLSFSGFPFEGHDSLPLSCGDRIRALELDIFKMSPGLQAIVQPSLAVDGGYDHLFLGADVEGDGADDPFFDFLSALRLNRSLSFTVVATFAISDNDLRSPRMYHLRTRCDPPTPTEGGCLVPEGYSATDLKGAARMRLALNEIAADRRQARLQAAFVAFSQVGLGSVAAYQPSFVALIGCLDVLTGGQGRSDQLPLRVSKVLNDDSVELLQFLEQCCNQRGHLGHGKPVESSPDWVNSKVRAVSLTRLYEIVRQVIQALLTVDVRRRREFLALAGPAWRIFESTGLPLRPVQVTGV